MLEILHDLRLSVRSLGRRPSYAVVSVILLAVGLAASTAVFNFVNMFYQPIPGVADGRRVVAAPPR